MMNKRIMPKAKKVTVKEQGPLQKAKRREMSDEEEAHEEIHLGKKDTEVYNTHALEELEEDDEIAPWEEGFMEGAHSEGEGAKCRNCGKVLIEEAIEREFNDEIHRFCSERCAEKFEEKD